MKRNIMAFGAHSDDIDIRAGATLAKFVAKGYQAVYIVVTTSASGIFRLSPNESIKIRHKEAIGAARCYNTKPIFLNFHQCCYPPGGLDRLPRGKISIATAFYDNRSIKLIEKLILKYRPQVIFTHSPDDLHEDHYHTARLIYKAWLRARKFTRASKLWFWENGSRGSMAGFSPNKFINVEKYLAVKGWAIKQHRSQVVGSPRLRTIARKKAKYWGKRCKFKLAEAFIEVRKVIRLSDLSR